MYNEEIYKLLLLEFGENKMAIVTDIISSLYDIKYSTSKNIDSLNEFDYERDWWKNKHIELVKQIETNL
jgi:hypothetical protein